MQGILDDYEIKRMAPPKRVHRNVGSNIHGEIRWKFKNDNKYKIYYECPVLIPIAIREKYKDKYETEFKKKFPKKYLIPDIVVLTDFAIDKDDCVDGAPDLVIEILSDSTAKFDTGMKRDIYKDIGVREYWTVGSNEIYIIQHDFINNDINILEEDEFENITSVIFPELILQREDIYK